MLSSVQRLPNNQGLSVRDYPVSAEDYELLEEAGRGVSATVSVLNLI